MTFSERINEKISKGRHTVNMMTNIGVKKGGVAMSVCNTVFWSIIIPILTFGSELWVLNQSDTEKLEKFQRYSGRRLQRFHFKSPNISSYKSLGWMGICRFIQAKKLIFWRTIAVMDENSVLKRMVVNRSAEYTDNIGKHSPNVNYSSVFDIHNISADFGLMKECLEVLNGIKVYNKLQWKNLVWSRAWDLEDRAWENNRVTMNNSTIITKICVKPVYLVWWMLADKLPWFRHVCEKMVRIVCGCSMLKCDDERLKRYHHSSRVCNLCDLNAIENIEHLLMQCPYWEHARTAMFMDLLATETNGVDGLVHANRDTLIFLLGGSPPGMTLDEMVMFWCVSAKHVTSIYSLTIKNRLHVLDDK